RREVRSRERTRPVVARVPAREDVSRSGRRRRGRGRARMNYERRRCWSTADELYLRYHDEEWGRPVRDESGVYERLCLEGFQSGLSWLTLLRKRPAFREEFAGFDPERVAAF